MTVIIQIHYTSTANTKSFQQGEFPLRGKKPEKVAHEFWKWIKKQIPIDVNIEKVLCENEDITEMVLELEKQETYKIMNDDLPF